MGLITIQNISPLIEVESEIAIVGSSSNILGKKLGKEIDSFSDVVRFNRAPTKEFEEEVGKKTTIRVANQHVFANISYGVSDRDLTQPQYFIKNQRNIKIVYLGPYLDEWGKREESIDSSCSPHLVDYQSSLSLYKNQILNGVSPGKNPTVGMMFISLCVCSGIRPHLYGFGTDEGTNISHYWEGRENHSVCHDYSLERQTLINLHSEGKIIIH